MTLRKKNQRAKIIKIRIPLAAAGGSGSGSGSGGGPGSGSGDGTGGYKPGENLTCIIIRREPGGYRVFDVAKGNHGFLPSDQKHNPGEEVQAQFVCVDKNLILLSERFTAGGGTPDSPQDAG